MTQADLAKALGRYQPFISNVESGQRRIDIELLDIADVIGFDPQAVLDELLRTPKG